jgi:hypothetical protein
MNYQFMNPVGVIISCVKVQKGKFHFTYGILVVNQLYKTILFVLAMFDHQLKKI